MNSGPAGFGSAPVSKVLIIVASGSSIFLQSSPSLIRSLGGPTVAVAQLFVFRHLGELVFGTVLLYYFRLLERQRGSERYGAYTTLTMCTSGLTHLALSTLTPWRLHCGPYAIIAANFVSFFADVPPVQRFTLFGVRMTDKVLVYAAGVQLFASAARHSFPSFMVGGLVGLAYQTNFLGFKKLKVPSGVSASLGRTIGRVLGGSGERRRVITTGAAPSTQQNARAPAPLGAPQRQVPVQPSAEALAQLISMGFEEQRASTALQQSNNDLQTALTRLL